MKVLWLTNTPSLSQEKTDSKIISGGWIAFLEKKINENKDVELAIAFYSKIKINTFSNNGTKYFPICSGRDSLLYRGKLWIENSYISKRDIKEIKEVISDFKPDIIHVHGTELGFGKIAEFTDIPVVISIQGNLSVIQKMYYRGLWLNDILKYLYVDDLFSQILYYKGYKKFKKRSRLEREILIRSKYIIGRTDWDRRITRLLAPGSRYFHNDEILRDCFYENIWKENETRNNKIIIHTTTSSPLYKGLETICETAFLLEENAGLDFHWNIAGLNKNDSIVKLCKRKFPGEYFERRLNFLGSLGSKKLVDNMLNADMFVSVSHIENSSNSLCEAMILGIPCIASFAGGTDTIINAGENGLLFQDGDPFSLAGIIIELVKNYHSGLEMGLKARGKAMERHNRDKIVQNLTLIYSQVIGK